MTWIDATARPVLSPGSAEPAPVPRTILPSVAINDGLAWARLVGVAPVPAASTIPAFQSNGFQPNAFQNVVPFTDNIDLDKGGNTDQMIRVFDGPSLGWTNTYVMHTRIITTGGTTVVNPGESFIIINVNADVTILLPSVRMWLTQPFGRPAVGFDRAIRFKVISASSVTLQPRGADTIDGLSGSTTLAAGIETLHPSPIGWIRGGDITGAAGPAGLTPDIGPNGTWWLGPTDTGVLATGPQGPAPDTSQFATINYVDQAVTTLTQGVTDGSVAGPGEVGQVIGGGQLLGPYTLSSSDPQGSTQNPFINQSIMTVPAGNWQISTQGGIYITSGTGTLSRATITAWLGQGFTTQIGASEIAFASSPSQGIITFYLPTLIATTSTTVDQDLHMSLEYIQGDVGATFNVNFVAIGFRKR